MSDFLTNMLGQMLNASSTTISLFFVTIIFSLPLGMILMLIYVGKAPIIRYFFKYIVGFYVLIMRGTPLLLQLFFFFYGLPYVPVIGEYLTFDRYLTCWIAFILNYSAYFSEIFRGGLLSVDNGQYEAAKVLGLSKFQTFMKIVLPQMLRVSLPAISNEAIILVKDTSLITALGVAELLRVTQNIVNRTTNVMPFAVAALFYLVMSWLLTLFFRWLEKRFAID